MIVVAQEIWEGDPTLFATLSNYKGSIVTFEDNDKDKIIGIGSIDNKFSYILEDVLLVVGLKANFTSISQMCNKSIGVLFVEVYKNVLRNLFETLDVINFLDFPYWWIFWWLINIAWVLPYSSKANGNVLIVGPGLGILTSGGGCHNY